MKKILGYSSIIVISFLIINTSVFAKVLPRYSPKNSVATTKSSSSSSTTYVSAKLRADRKALLVTFLNLQSVKSIDYMLTYTASGADQGVTGSVDVSAGGSISRELVFGTESKGVYTYHTNIKNMKFVVTIVLKNGRTVVKKYVVKP